MVSKSAFTGSSLTYDRRAVSHVRTYNWPPIQLNFWIFVMLLASTTIIGVFSIFIEIQNQLLLPIPWYFPYYITVAGLGIVFIGIIFWLIAERRLLPAIVMIGAFMLFVLWVVGLIVIAIELFGPNGSVQSVCNNEVFNRSPKGQSEETLAWLQQRNICQSWQLVFAMALTGGAFLIWIMIMAYQVFVDS
ncbi:Fc.00g026080.m01.CDS01 [Cosmosporella sp. VM-42]